MKILPSNPNLQFLLREAKALKSSHRNGNTGICAAVGRFDTSFHGLSDQAILDSRFSILDAQRVVSRLYGFSSWSRLKKYVDRSVQGKIPSDMPLRNTVFHRNNELKELLTAYKSKQGDYESKLDQFIELSLESVSFLENAFEQHGWPGPDVVGADCVEALVHVSANATYNAKFQDESTRLMGEALSEGGIDARCYACLRDRYLVLSNEPSVYGTTFDTYSDDNGEFKLVEYDVVAPENLEKRRAQVGYESLEAERDMLAKRAVEENWKLRSYKQCMKASEELSIKGGYRSV